MGMFSEAAIENTVGAVVGEIEKGLEENKDKPETLAALKKVGRFALTLFEWSTPDWAKKYGELFKE